MGHSIGRWEGDVLVVDTIGTSGRTRGMNGVGSNARVSRDDSKPRLPVSDQLHLVERIRLVADGEILERRDDGHRPEGVHVTARLHALLAAPAGHRGARVRLRRASAGVRRGHSHRADEDHEKPALIAACTVVAGVVTADAHHSFAAFDRSKEVTFTGVVRDVQWNNPHTWIQVLVTDDNGRQTEWGFECGSPNMMSRTGWTRRTLKNG